MLTPCACGHHVRRHVESGCGVPGCACRAAHDAIARRLNRRVSPHAISAVWCRQADGGDLTYHAVGVLGDRRGTPPPRTPAACQPSATWGRWRRSFQLRPIPELRCSVCLAELPRWHARMATNALPAASAAGAPALPTTNPSPVPPGAYRDPRDPCVVFVPLRLDPRRADYSARDVEAALARLR